MAKKRVAKQTDIDLNRRISQEQFGRMIGISQQDVSKLYRFEVLSHDGTAKDWTREYIRFQMGVIFGRRGWDGLAKALGD